MSTRYHVPAAGDLIWDSVLANLEPGPEETSVRGWAEIADHWLSWAERRAVSLAE